MYASRPAAPPAPAPLSEERFAEVIELARTRKADPAAQARLAADPDTAEAWAGYVRAVDRAVGDINREAQFKRSKDLARGGFGRAMRAHYDKYYPTRAKHLRSAELAILLGEIRRVAALPDEALGQEALGATDLAPLARMALGDETRLLSLYPLISAASDVFLRHQRPELEPTEAPFRLPEILDVVKDLDRLQAACQFKTAPITKGNVAPTIVPEFAEILTSNRFLGRTQLAQAFQRVYDAAWHTATKTKTATGGFVGGLRDRAKVENCQELLVVLAAGSDGRNRGVSGVNEHTPSPVYDQLIYDNSLGVLLEVVKNKQFNDYKAFAMVDTGLAPQITAVMLGGRIDGKPLPFHRVNMSVRVLAAERAIKHEGVDFPHIFRFLRWNTRSPEVLPALWRDWALETQRRLNLVRVHGTEKEVAEVERRLKTITEEFTEGLLVPYWKAVKEQERLEAAEERNPSYVSDYNKAKLAEARGHVQAHEFLRDPIFIDLLVDGVRKDEDLVQMLRYCVEAKIPLAKKLLLKVLKHESLGVRKEGNMLVRNTLNVDVDTLAAEVQARVDQDYAVVRSQVFTGVIPDYEKIEGEARLLSRMHHYFEAADELPLPELVDRYVACAKKDPRAIPDAFREATMLRRTANRFQVLIDDAEGAAGPGARAADEAERTPATPLPDLSGMVQADLFGGLAGDGGSAMVKKSSTRRARG